MCVFVRIIIITLCLCASPRPLVDSLQIPVKIGNLRKFEVLQLLLLCSEFMNLEMRGVTIYTAKNKDQIKLNEHVTNADLVYKGTAQLSDYNLAVVKTTLYNLHTFTAYPHLLPEISLRIINVVESVGVFLLIKICMLARFVASISQAPRILLTTSLLLSMYDIYQKFDKLSIPLKPVEDLKAILKQYTYELDFDPKDVAYFEGECFKFIYTYSFLSEFVYIGNVDMTSFDPYADSREKFLQLQLDFIQKNVEFYFRPLRLDNRPSAVAPSPRIY